MNRKICQVELCTGCGACMQVCPRKCIDLIDDREGFWYPHINKDMCIDCYRCEKVCPAVNKVTFNPEGSYYMGWSKNQDILMDSATGGFFSALSYTVLDEGGVVFGAFYDTDTNSVFHTCISSTENLYLLRKSKYFQSNTQATFSEVKWYLSQNRVVLYTGTPCQIAGLKAYLKLVNVSIEKLVTGEVLCHGVANHKIVDAYIADTQKREGKKIDHIAFRTKDNGWSNGRGTAIKLFFDDGTTKVMKRREDLFFMAFNDNLILRPSCYSCKYAQPKRNADFTMGDFWNVELVPEEQQEKGVSAFSVNSVNAQYWIEKLTQYFVIKRAEKEAIVRHNRTYTLPSEKNAKREKFFRYLNRYGYYNSYYLCYPSYWFKITAKRLLYKKPVCFIKKFRGIK